MIQSLSRIAYVKQVHDHADELLDRRLIEAINKGRAFLSATIKLARLSTLKWPESVDRASEKQSAISPAVICLFRRSRRISRRVGSLRAWKTSFIGPFVISRITEI